MSFVMIAPWLSVPNATQAVDFYKAAFGAVEVDRLEAASGSVVVAQLSIGDATFWVQQDDDSSPQSNGRSPVRMILIVDDPDALFARAVAAGALQVAAIHQDRGWRAGRIADICGHQWE